MEYNQTTLLKRIFSALQRHEKECPAPGKEEVLQAIQREIALKKKKQKRHRLYLYAGLSIASSFLLFLLVDSKYLSMNPQTDHLLELAQKMERNETNTATSDEIILELSTQEQITLQKDDEVKYSAGGKIQVNQKEIKRAEVEEKEEKTEEIIFNQLTVPLGKRSKLLLADGTNVWVNSGTRVIYPATFKGKTREIFVDGEVYMDVFKDINRPFIVRTKQFNVRVLGTSFNISTYSQESHSTVVLVNGKVNITDDNSHEVNLQPGQLSEIRKGIAAAPVYVDVKKYIGWIDDILILDDMPLSQALRKLRLYYGKEFVSSPQIDALYTSGKLELKNDFSKVMKTLTFSLPISYKETDNKIYLEYNKESE